MTSISAYFFCFFFAFFYRPLSSWHRGWLQLGEKWLWWSFLSDSESDTDLVSLNDSLVDDKSLISYTRHPWNYNASGTTFFSKGRGRMSCGTSASLPLQGSRLTTWIWLLVLLRFLAFSWLRNCCKRLLMQKTGKHFICLLGWKYLIAEPHLHLNTIFTMLIFFHLLVCFPAPQPQSAYMKRWEITSVKEFRYYLGLPFLISL